MPWPNLSMPALDWHHPWRWPCAFQRLAFGASAVFGGLLLSPWGLGSWQAFEVAREAQVKRSTQQQATLELREQTAQMQQSLASPELPVVDATTLSQLAQQQGLQLSGLGSEKPLQPAALVALQMQQLPMHLHVQGSWEAWLGWLAQWPSAAPGVLVTSLELKAHSTGGIAAQVVAVAPQPIVHDAAVHLAVADLAGAPSADPFNARTWTHTQHTYAQQHPSYARLVVPELQRAREPLEAFSRERLQFVGQIASGAEVQALVKVLPAVGVKNEPAMMTVHRLRVGEHLGKNFGRVLAISAAALTLQELVLASTGEWLTLEVSVPLHEVLPP